MTKSVILSHGFHTKDRGPWMQTWSGGKFYPFSPEKEDVILEDIAHQLSMMCRFNGATRFHYSVAQHSVYVAELMFHRFAPDAHFKSTKCQLSKSYAAMVGLLHDAPEAYIGDMIRPIKFELAEFREIETKIDIAVKDQFELTKHGCTLDSLLSKCDDIMLETEKLYVMNNNMMSLLTNAEWPLNQTPVDIVRPMNQSDAKRAFLECFNEHWNEI